MDRRSFLEKSALMMAGLGTSQFLHPSILKASSILPAKGSTFYDAEHIVILMQENRSFDHAFGSMKGVRGFLDKRAFVKKDGKSVFFQEKDGKYAFPSRLDIKNTKSTWMSSLPHSWNDQIIAFNGGKYDKWLQAKASGNKNYSEMPLTMGYYNREDLPFYYQLADAFTIGDHYFCSSFTGTTPNRLYHWSGTIRKEKNGSVKANVYNGDIDYDSEDQASWKSFPEILEENHISWKVYQNEISLPKGMTGEQDAWLSNFTDNPLEWFENYKVRFSPGYYHFIPQLIEKLKAEKPSDAKKAAKIKTQIHELENDLVKYKPENFEKLSAFEKNIHKKAFSRNEGDPDFWNLEESTDEAGRRLVVPKGDVLHQFRQDAEERKLPLVSWLIAPERFSDHPGSPWYGAWYISEVMNILTKNPEVWKKTIFIINYDENDGYFDHVVPFTPPNNPSQPVDFNGETGVEFVSKQQTYMQQAGDKEKNRIEGPIGLGYRVPLIVASPWSRGGFVNSEVFDHTSVIKFIEKFIEKKFKKNVKTDLISHWRRAVCGDLTSVFQSGDAAIPNLDYINQKSFTSHINAAKDKPVPELKWISSSESGTKKLELQERGTKKSNALPYQFLVNLKKDGILMENLVSKGVPLQIFDRNALSKDQDFYFSYALYDKDNLVHKVNEGNINFEVFGPNGFFRSFAGDLHNQMPDLKLVHDDQRKVYLIMESPANGILQIKDLYTGKNTKILLKPGKQKVEIATPQNSGWYDVEVLSDKFKWHFSGRAENGKPSISDPHWA